MDMAVTFPWEPAPPPLRHNQFYQSVYRRYASPQHYLFWTAGYQSNSSVQDNKYICPMPSLKGRTLLPL